MILGEATAATPMMGILVVHGGFGEYERTVFGVNVAIVEFESFNFLRCVAHVHVHVDVAIVVDVIFPAGRTGSGSCAWEEAEAHHVMVVMVEFGRAGGVGVGFGI